MKAIVDRNELVALLGKIQSIIPSKPVLPILSNVLLKAENDQLVISATDLTISIRLFINAKVIEEGGVTLPARRLFQLIRELTTSQIELHGLTPEMVQINAGTSHFKIQGIHESEFPAFPDLKEGKKVKLSSSLLKKLLNRTSFAAAREDSRQVLNGILMLNNQAETTFIGTDGKKLAKVHTAISLAEGGAGSYILPLKAVEEMVKILESKEEEVSLVLMHDKIALELGSLTFITKLLSGQYPDVSRVIPQKTSSSIILHREELISLLRQISLFTSENSSSVRFSFSDGTLSLSATSGELGEGKVHMPVNYAGPALDVGFNPHSFLGILHHSDDETVQLDITGPYNPGLITDSSTAEFVIMPMRLD